jgi:hypothetical protein
MVPNGDFGSSSLLMEPLVASHSTQHDSFSNYYSGPFSLQDSSIVQPPTTTDTALPHRFSVWIGTAVGFVLESACLAWHTAAVAHQRPSLSHSTAAPTVVLILLWVLVTVAAPLLAFIHWMEWLDRRHHGDRHDHHQRNTSEGTVTRAATTGTVEWWFGLGIVLGVTGACLVWDALLGSNHVSFSVQIAAATAAVGTLALRLYRSCQQPQRQRRADKRSTLYDAVDPEQLDVVELSPGTLTL